MLGDPLIAHGTGVGSDPSGAGAREQYERRDTSGNHGKDEPAH
jgi:hypothetical protein